MMRGRTSVCLKQPISTPRLILLIFRGAKVRGFRLSNCAGADVRGVAMTSGSTREANKERTCIALECRPQMQKA